MVLERPHWDIAALDKSEKAINIAKINAKQLKAHVEFYHSDWFQNIPNLQFDIIVSNPPYIEPNDSHLEQLQYEPKIALVSEDNGLKDIKTLLKNAPLYLKNNGLIIIEHGYNQANDVADFIISQNNWSEPKHIKDLNHHNRATYCYLKSN